MLRLADGYVFAVYSNGADSSRHEVIASGVHLRHFLSSSAWFSLTCPGCWMPVQIQVTPKTLYDISGVLARDKTYYPMISEEHHTSCSPFRLPRRSNLPGSSHLDYKRLVIPAKERRLGKAGAGIEGTNSPVPLTDRPVSDHWIPAPLCNGVGSALQRRWGLPTARASLCLENRKTRASLVDGVCSYSSSAGWPQPPPPGVRMLSTSPASTSRVSLPARCTSS